jgi:hypothetical protein
MRHLFIFLLFMALPVQATHANEFEVQNIAVDVQGDNAIDAREKALIKARRNAFDILTGRLLDSDERSSLPQTDDQTIATMVNDFEIIREKLSKNRYLANVSINFNPRAVRGYLGRYTNAALPDPTTQMVMGQMNTVAEQTEQTPNLKRLILPWYGQDSDVTLWRDTNPWKQAWNSWLGTSQGRQSSLIVPIGDITDMQYFNPEKPLNFDSAGLDRLLQRYKANDAIIAMADPLTNGMIRVSLYQSTNMMPRFIDRIVVPSSTMSNANQFLPAIYKSVDSIQTVDAAPYSPANEQIAVNDTSSFALDNTINTPFEAEIRLNTIQQWIGIKQSLGMISGLSDVQVKSLSSARAVVAFRYTGDSDALRRDLNARGLGLYANPQQVSGASPFIITRQQG